MGPYHFDMDFHHHWSQEEEGGKALLLAYEGAELISSMANIWMVDNIREESDSSDNRHDDGSHSVSYLLPKYRKAALQVLRRTLKTIP